MRGFPLINSLLVIAFFAVAWWPLRQATSARASAPEPAPKREVETEDGHFSGSIRIAASHPLKSVTLMHEGEELLLIDAPEAGLEIEETLPAFEPDPEGIEFWIEAEFSVPPSGGQRGALKIELIPDDVELETATVTLWGQEEEGKIGDTAFFPPAITP